MRTNYDYIIAIDPDAKASGIANLDVRNARLIRSGCMPFPELIKYIEQECSASAKEGVKIVVIIEASWLSESASKNSYNWHINEKDSKKVAAAKGAGVARNQETGRKIVEMLEYYKIEVVKVYPLIKCWSGPDRKIAQQEIEQIIPDFPKRSTQDQRDAALLAWNYSGYPIRIKVQSKKK